MRATLARAAALALGLTAAHAAAGPDAPPAPAQTPQTQARPAQDATPSFAVCRAELVAFARAHGVPPEVAAAQLDPLTPDPEVLAATRGQGEFARTLWDYIEGAVTEARVSEGQRKLDAWAPTLAAIETRYDVDRYTLVAFWGVESGYGAALDDPRAVRPVVRSLASLACGDPGRAAYWRDELAAALRMLARGDAAPGRLTGDLLTGSWAGAMGHTQFMPTVYERAAVDFDGDGRRDLWSVPDALASTANYLRAAGWRPGEPWGYEAALPAGFDPALADETTARSLAAWAALGVSPARDRPAADPDARATLILPAGVRGPAFLILPNFSAILRYNTAFAYALTVGHLADRLRGEPGFRHDWPRGDRALTADERRALQAGLDARGFPTGGVDGKVGPRTRAAVRAFQAAQGLPADGYADPALLELLRAAP